MEKIEEETKIEKPKFLYHGSPHGDIEELEPRVSPGSGEKYGALIYASPDLAAASIFMAKVNGSWSATRLSSETYDILCIIISEPRDEFIKNDKGGHIYVLPSDTFEIDLGRGLKDKEWASKEKVKPIKKIEYASALDTIIENGVQVYFVDKETYEKLVKVHGYDKEAILMGLESENQRRGVNIKKLP